MLDGIFHDGLQGQRRHAEPGMRRIVLDKQAVLIQGLLHGEVGAGVFQLRRKWDERGAGNGSEIFPQVGGKIHDDLSGQFWILIAETIDACHGVVDEMRTHLQHGDAGALIRDFPLMLQILLDLIRQDEAVHGQSREDITDIEEQEDINEHQHDQSGYHRQYGGEKAVKCFT